MAVIATVKADKSQGRFYDALTDLFVGAPVEGQSGLINLMRIKHRYYKDGVPPKLDRDIEAALNAGRNSIGIDIDPEYCRMALRRLDSESGPLFARASIEYHTAADLAPATEAAVADKPRKRKGR